jgi:regulator of cell morphogenesis and NO signaling
MTQRPADSPTASSTGRPTDSSNDIVRAALEHEHREIDRSIEDFIADRSRPADATAQLRRALAELRRHIYVEEEFLFPPLRAAGMLGPVLVMLSEHRDLWRTMTELERGLADGATRAEVEGTARTLLAQLDRHNSKEEPIIYGQADALLPVEDRTELRDRLADDMPAGWACLGLV